MSELPPGTVLVRREVPAVEWVEVEGQVIAWVADRGELHHLDGIATLIFHLCDGGSDLARTVAELAESFGHPVEAIAPDVMGCAARLHADGLVEAAPAR